MNSQFNIGAWIALNMSFENFYGITIFQFIVIIAM